MKRSIFVLVMMVLAVWTPGASGGFFSSGPQVTSPSGVGWESNLAGEDYYTLPTGFSIGGDFTFDVGPAFNSSVNGNVIVTYRYQLLVFLAPGSYHIRGSLDGDFAIESGTGTASLQSYSTDNYIDPIQFTLFAAPAPVVAGHTAEVFVSAGNLPANLSTDSLSRQASDVSGSFTVSGAELQYNYILTQEFTAVFNVHNTSDTNRMAVTITLPTETSDDTFLEPLDAAVPEPGTLTLCGIGLAGLAGYAWRRRKTAA